MYHGNSPASSFWSRIASPFSSILSGLVVPLPYSGSLGRKFCRQPFNNLIPPNLPHFFSWRRCLVDEAGLGLWGASSFISTGCASAAAYPRPPLSLAHSLLFPPSPSSSSRGPDLLHRAFTIPFAIRLVMSPPSGLIDIAQCAIGRWSAVPSLAACLSSLCLRCRGCRGAWIIVWLPSSFFFFFAFLFTTCSCSISFSPRLCSSEMIYDPVHVFYIHGYTDRFLLYLV